MRICMCNQLAAISRAVGFDAAEKVVLPEVLELVKDEERSVRLSAYQCLVELLLGGPSLDVVGSTGVNSAGSTWALKGRLA